MDRKLRLLQICARTSMLALQACNFGKSVLPIASFRPRLVSTYPIKVPRALGLGFPGLVKLAPRVSADLQTGLIQVVLILPLARHSPGYAVYL